MKKKIKVFLILGVSFLIFLILCSIVVCKVPTLADVLWIPIIVTTTFSAWFLLAIPPVIFWVLIRLMPLQAKLISIIIAVFALGFLEFYLRKTGSVPGFMCSKEELSQIGRIVPIDSLVDDGMMVADSFGVTKFNPNNGKGFFRGVNSEGFSSLHEFNQKTTDSLHVIGKEAILGIGDSYLFGMSADNGCGFADLLEETGKYAIMNAGIPGTDVAQYVGVVKEYIGTKALRPDEVVIFLCGANDIHHMSKRVLKPFVPLLYSTNVIPIYSWRDGADYDTTAKDAYRSLLEDTSVKEIVGGNVFGRIAESSVVATKIFGIVRIYFFVGMIPFALSQEENYSALLETQKILFAKIFGGDEIHKNSVLVSYMEEMRDICNKAGVSVRFILVPGREMVEEGVMPNIPGVISVPTNLIPLEDYEGNGGASHPKNLGHQKIFEEVIKILQNPAASGIFLFY